MHDRGDDAGARQLHAGLCDSCAWQRVVTSARGSRFSLCRRSATDPRFERYPALPVVSCDGYEPERPPGGSAESRASSGSCSSPSTSPSTTSGSDA